LEPAFLTLEYDGNGPETDLFRVFRDGYAGVEETLQYAFTLSLRLERCQNSHEFFHEDFDLLCSKVLSVNNFACPDFDVWPSEGRAFVDKAVVVVSDEFAWATNF
jgi:hypothetical protein